MSDDYRKGYASGYAAGLRARKWQGRQSDPKLLIHCACGASWKGLYAVNNPIIDRHRQRPGCQLTKVSTEQPAEDQP